MTAGHRGRARSLLACPKSMTYGPCGGVNPDGSCEVHTDPCVFLDRPLPVPVEDAASATRPPPTAAAGEIADILARRPLIMTGFPARPLTAEDVSRVADVLAPNTDAALSGDAATSRTQFPPSYRGHLMTAAGVRAWIGVNTRDRNRVALEGELAALRHAGVAGVHCVTGDHTDTGDRPDAAPVFDLESTTLLPRAREAGLVASFAESPCAPPRESRGVRVAYKQRAGGRMCLTQYCGGVEDVAAFVEACRRAGATVPVLPGVPAIVDEDGAALLASFHAASLPPGYAERLRGARDMRAEGVRLAIEYGSALLEVPGVAGVVVAGGARRGDEIAYAGSLATIARELGGGS
ncbi:methylenetetrahydrofolate reductase C-terminal domain-containing protein [Microbacterium aquimaris]|uniref:methylenetetrahydrofolate reductase C-terminal domain-containing protein n=1 Tax=Microbacterium aquimaris TaxID=459816 RepID=UPI002AD3BFDB|nr:methylenetetrahydrofolate reductase C-terminal domain-containing protein [Microbacterium aquimaris]MDZ8274615.1 methylenetetrahydrofolate reductase C-terminal domain-containing protein [Microbacterium aquimaris]